MTAASLCWQTGKTDLVKGEGERQHRIVGRDSNCPARAAVIYFASCQTRNQPCPGIRCGSPRSAAAHCSPPTVALILLCSQMLTSKQVILHPHQEGWVLKLLLLGTQKSSALHSLPRGNKQHIATEVDNGLTQQTCNGLSLLWQDASRSLLIIRLQN